MSDEEEEYEEEGEEVEEDEEGGEEDEAKDEAGEEENEDEDAENEDEDEDAEIEDEDGGDDDGENENENENGVEMQNLSSKRKHIEKRKSFHDQAASVASKKKGVRLTVAQLASLYRRLDINGDGEVDLSEFLNVSRKLKMSADPQFLSETFRKVDLHGTLTRHQVL